MRSNVLDYLKKVCEAYELQRETFYLAQDIFDRFMMMQVDIGTDQLQLIATAALYIAAKVKGSYPPCIYAFACVTDGICTKSEIRDMEFRILKALNWHLLPLTAVSWLKLYTQFDALKDCQNFLVCQFSQEKYIQMAQLLDLCILDINALDFQYRVLAAAVFYYFSSAETVDRVTGLKWDTISICVDWMAPFVKMLNGYSWTSLKEFKNVAAENWHNIQTCVDYFKILDFLQQEEQKNRD